MKKKTHPIEVILSLISQLDKTKDYGDDEINLTYQPENDRWCLTIGDLVFGTADRSFLSKRSEEELIEIIKAICK